MPSDKRFSIKNCKKKVLKLLEQPYCVAVAASLTCTIVVSGWNYFFAIKPVNDKVNNIEMNIGTMIDASVNNKMEVINENINNQITILQNEMNNEFTEIRNDMTSIINNNHVIIEIHPTAHLIDAVKSTYQSDQTVYLSSGTPVDLDIQQVIATDKITGGEYRISDLENKTISMSYDDNGEEVFFKGQLDENGYWNDNCVINKYRDGNLIMIMDAVYESGKLISYQQVFPYINLSGNDVWVVSERQVIDEGDARSGETFMYFKNGEYVKSFNNEDVSGADIINVNEFRKSIDIKIEGYYSGYTANGKYNDDSQNAYLVKYKPNGEVRYLYVGKVKDGFPHDDTGNAWAISWGYADDGYYYYQGKFVEGKHDAPPNWRTMTQEEINDVINPEQFNCPLIGLVDKVF